MTVDIAGQDEIEDVFALPARHKRIFKELQMCPLEAGKEIAVCHEPAEDRNVLALLTGGIAALKNFQDWEVRAVDEPHQGNDID